MIRVWEVEPGTDGYDSTIFDCPAQAGEAAAEIAEELYDDNEDPVGPTVMIRCYEMARSEYEAELEAENATLTEALGRDDATLAVLDQELQAWMALEERARKAIEAAERAVSWQDKKDRAVMDDLVAVVRAYLADEEEEHHA